jgi:hypothetical protein
VEAAGIEPAQHSLHLDVRTQGLAALGGHSFKQGGIAVTDRVKSSYNDELVEIMEDVS